MALWQDFLTNEGGRQIHKWKHYFHAYERHFQPFVNRPLVMWEVGCGQGGSLQMWKRYFGPHALIIGIDIEPESAHFAEDQIIIKIGSQSDTHFLQGILDEYGPPNIVIDDGSHLMPDVVATFRYMYHRTAWDGVYVVEDLHTAYWPEYGGGLRHPGSFIELTKDLIDELNADWSRGELPPTLFTKSTMSMHMYDSMVVFERGHHLGKSAPQIGYRSDGKQTQEMVLHLGQPPK